MIAVVTLEQFKNKRNQIPDTPGVYFFLGPRRNVLYIGKATSLRERTRSYFGADLGDTRGALIAEMLAKARSLDWRQTDSVLEALILEANLIRAHKPPYNTALKDDKSWNHVVITDEDFPRVLLVRGKELKTENLKLKTAYVFGPFPHGLQLKEALKLVRKIFPYRDTCTPCDEQRTTNNERRTPKNKPCKPCFNSHIGLCPGVCSGAVTKTEYRRIVRHIMLLFQGKKGTLIRSLEREMKAAAKAERFEEAARLRRQMFALNHIQDVSLIKDEYRIPHSSASVPHLFRVEAYDAAHLAGSAAVGVMTVVENGLSRSSEYRKFQLRGTKPGDDTGALREILSRRLNHPEWQMPRVIVVDGGTAQMNAAQSVLDEAGIQIPIVGVVKDEKHRPRSISGDKAVIAGLERDILQANAEAHRYAIAYHRNKSRKGLV